MELSEKIIETAKEFANSRYNYEVSYITKLLKELHLSEDDKQKLGDWLESHIKTCCRDGYMRGVSDSDTKESEKRENVIENEFNETWVKVEDKDILAKIENCLTGTKDERFCLEYAADVKTSNDVIPHMIIGLHGGLNGNGKWNIYLINILSIVNRLRRIFRNVTILDIKNDVLDDVFDVRIVVSGAIKN